MSIAHFTLATRDVIATRDFFAETLGWEPITRPDNVEVDAAWLRIAPGQVAPASCAGLRAVRF